MATHILSGLQVILGVALVVLVLMHSGKDTGLSGMLNPGGSSYGGTAVMERNLTRLTIFVARALHRQRDRARLPALAAIRRIDYGPHRLRWWRNW